MEDLRLEADTRVKPRSPKGRAAARGLDARIRFQHASCQRETQKSDQPNQKIKNPLDSDHGIYRAGRCTHWIKIKNRKHPAHRREQAGFDGNAGAG